MNIAIDIFYVVAQIAFFPLFLETLTPRFSKKVTTISSVLAFSFAFTFCIVFFAKSWRGLAMTAIILLVVFVCFKDNVFKKLSFFALITIINLGCEILSFYIIKSILKVTQENIINEYMQLCYLVFTILLMFSYAVVHFVLNKKTINFTTTQWIQYSFFPISQISVVAIYYYDVGTYSFNYLS